jgi:hypothetical protein
MAKRTKSTQPATPPMDAALAHIAREYLGLETLESRHSDSLDFAEQGVWAIRDALEAAYRAGVAEATGAVADCRILVGLGEDARYLRPDCREMVDDPATAGRFTRLEAERIASKIDCTGLTVRVV